MNSGSSAWHRSQRCRHDDPGRVGAVLPAGLRGGAVPVGARLRDRARRSARMEFGREQASAGAAVMMRDLRHCASPEPSPAAWWVTGSLVGALLLAHVVASYTDAEGERRAGLEQGMQAEQDRMRGANLIVPLADCPAGTGPLLLIIERDQQGRPVAHDCRVVISRGQAARGWKGRAM